MTLSDSKIRKLLEADLAWAKKHRRLITVKRVKEMLAKIAARKT